MPFTHTITDEFVHIQWHGDLTKDDLVRLGALMPEVGAKLGRAPNVLHTFDEITGGPMQPWDAFQHSLRIEDARLPNKAKSAAVAKTPKVRGMAALFTELNRNPYLIMRIFDSEAEALAWLREPVSS